jgi:DNA-binding NtrC family response regulator
MTVDLLIVDDDRELCQRSAQFFEERGYRVAQANDGEQALALALNRVFHVAILDLMLPGMTGIELLEKLKQTNIETEVILLTGEGTIETAVRAMQLGAIDFLTKPVRFQQLAAVLEKAVEAGDLRRENRQLKAVIDRAKTTTNMIGDSPAMREVRRLIERAGPSEKPILIQGESGTGKELVAKALHQASHLADKPFVVINCAALPETLLESELFGFEKGSFTGAAVAKAGLFEIADGGTLFIDEVGEMASSLQPKLLRVLEDGSMRRIGSIKERHVRVRIIAATNRDLLQEVEAKRFREDLYYRINVMTIQLPPLRQRGNDVLQLADSFAGPGWEWEPRARETLRNYNWPGNVRQLINAIDRAKLLAEEHEIRLENLPPEIARADSRTKGPPRPEDGDLVDLASVNRSFVVEAMKQENGNKSRAATKLGVTRRSLYRLLDKYNIAPNEYGFELHESVAAERSPE